MEGQRSGTEPSRRDGNGNSKYNLSMQIISDLRYGTWNVAL